MTAASDFVERREDWKSFVAVVGHLAIVLAPVFLAGYLGTWTWLLAGYLWFGMMQNGVANLMHEAAHRIVFNKARWSDVLGHWVLAPFFLTNFELYRRRHWVHHRHAGTDDDTKQTYLTEFQGVADLIAFGLRCLVGIEAVKRFATTLKENAFVAPLTAAETRQGLVDLVTFHAVFACSLFVVALVGAGGEIVPAVARSVLAYGIVYLYGMATLTILLSTLRAIAEHHVLSNDTQVVGKAAIRNLTPTLATRTLFGSYGFCEHGTHHSFPAIPYYNLPSATRTLSQGESSLMYGPSYWGILAQSMQEVRPASAHGRGVDRAAGG